MVDSFLAEARLEKPLTLDHLNKLFWVWLDECYQNKPHSALGKDISPAAAYNGIQKPLRFLDAKTIADAFLHTEERKVDKAGCISFMNKKYEAGLPFIGCTVSVVYDPADISTLTLEYEGHAPWNVSQLVIGERTGTRPKLPPHMQPHPAVDSRLLQAATKQNQTRKERQTPVVSYRRKDGKSHV